MARVLIAAFWLLGLMASAGAAETKYFVEMDTVGNCSVVDSKPSASAGMKILGKESGYSSRDDAVKGLKGLPKGKCKGLVGVD